MLVVDHRAGRRMELAKCLTLVPYVHAVTARPVARIDQAGSYAAPSLRGEAFAVRPRPILLRVDSAGVAAAAGARDGGTVALVPARR